jgi:hypothetical protein
VSRTERKIFFGHPSGGSRIRMAMTWNAKNPAQSARPSQ